MLGAACWGASALSAGMLGAQCTFGEGRCEGVGAVW